MHPLLLPVPPGGVSDGYHTFDELYDHRNTLFLALMASNPFKAWVSRKHNDQTGLPGWFLAGIATPEGDVTYHIPDHLWSVAQLTGCKILESAPAWDGHSPEDVLGRLVRHLIIRKTPDEPKVDTKSQP